MLIWKNAAPCGSHSFTARVIAVLSISKSMKVFCHLSVLIVAKTDLHALNVQNYEAINEVS
jgi:hypothetical protein